MEEDEQLRSFMLLMTYLLLKRRRDINNANIQRRNEIQRRIRHRYYFFQRQRRMLMVSLHFTRQFCCNLLHIVCFIITAHWWCCSLHSSGPSTRYYLETKLTIPRYWHVLQYVLQFILRKIHKTIKSQYHHSLSHSAFPPPKKTWHFPVNFMFIASSRPYAAINAGEAPPPFIN